LSAWLGIDAPKTAALHAAQSVELDLTQDAAQERCRYGIEGVLGGVIREERSGTIEATFGLIGSERLTCTIAAIGGERSRVTLETRRGAQAGNPPRSPYVKALAEYLAG
jgi:hypothetical protein